MKLIFGLIWPKKHVLTHKNALKHRFRGFWVGSKFSIFSNFEKFFHKGILWEMKKFFGRGSKKNFSQKFLFCMKTHIWANLAQKTRFNA